MFHRVQKIVSCLMVILLLAISAVTVSADLLSDKTQELNQLRQKIEEQQKLLDAARKRSATLQNQLDILQKQIEVAELQLQAIGTQIEKTNAEISRINGELVDAEVQIYDKKRVLREAIKESYMRRQTGVLEVVLGSSNLSELISQLEYITTIEGRITSSLSTLQELNATLKESKGKLETADKELKELQAAKQLEQNSLGVQIGAKDALLGDAKLTEVEYQKRLAEAVIEQQRLQREIARLAAGSRRDALNQGNYSLLWPVPSRQISAGFHDADYLARFKMVHNAIDIPTPQGTPVRAPADAFVAKVYDSGGIGYSYLVLDHGNGMVTVYGHMSSMNVGVEQFVPVGSVVGLSGGTPGTQGAGWLTTGPHLHFEVWLDGQARNPLGYLVG